MPSSSLGPSTRLNAAARNSRGRSAITIGGGAAQGGPRGYHRSRVYNQCMKLEVSVYGIDGMMRETSKTFCGQ
jgi:hypothetical protein